MSVQYKPNRYHTIPAYLAVDGADEAITLLSQVFDATQVLRMDGPDGRIGHAELRIGDSTLMIADVLPSGKANTALLRLCVQ